MSSVVSTNSVVSGGAKQPRVAIVMGSDSDWPTMSAAADVLDELGIPYFVDVVSAHRMPHQMIQFGTDAKSKGFEVIIAGAGGAAHLPGMLASVTPLPVIGVPVSLKNLDGLDSLLSIVQMPGGVPVATMAVDGSKNAGLYAARILGCGAGEEASRISAALADYAEQMRAGAEAKGRALSEKRAAESSAQ
ncbi:5-(carboxyamino)imidazole ribonucleotide mutase [Pseudoglutamicibacter cumminsii]|uniref:5-(carboxyamino)imidazole ribonucleotide mutase n=1 Tax=Pseudoglutamicibacter cumminsii TaxID=156979 RepID=UPI0025533E1D|nr:5-(carboxyamino)imidazole ribonucleotide mutase [Pseudoglutamicibacter cumminsii]MDK7083742.1 5-(carboxyamino)imidazole ribonucleotide mutase [Pseudoglutamicibacter cumminsii]